MGESPRVWIDGSDHTFLVQCTACTWWSFHLDKADAMYAMNQHHNLSALHDYQKLARGPHRIGALCIEEGCNRAPVSAGRCRPHIPSRLGDRPCSIDGCTENASGKGDLCYGHAQNERNRRKREQSDAA